MAHPFGQQSETGQCRSTRIRDKGAPQAPKPSPASGSQKKAQDSTLASGSKRQNTKKTSAAAKTGTGTVAEGDNDNDPAPGPSIAPPGRTRKRAASPEPKVPTAPSSTVQAAKAGRKRAKQDDSKGKGATQQTHFAEGVTAISDSMSESAKSKSTLQISDTAPSAVDTESRDDATGDFEEFDIPSSDEDVDEDRNQQDEDNKEQDTIQLLSGLKVTIQFIGPGSSPWNNVISPYSHAAWPSTQVEVDGWSVLMQDILSTAQEYLGTDRITNESRISYLDGEDTIQLGKVESDSCRTYRIHILHEHQRIIYIYNSTSTLTQTTQLGPSIPHPNPMNPTIPYTPPTEPAPSATIGKASLGELSNLWKVQQTTEKQAQFNALKDSHRTTARSIYETLAIVKEFTQSVPIIPASFPGHGKAVPL
ncbi:uncharacterized protein EI90DRAFT_3115739 [Cantharellus anzutake]|uniref:uncharacterized protein n=1 Tax=Cantharellus anzutake TaxID=1750568 RepID=UPI0019082B6E|nr:uncharacterized protein EI90DRAFT_3115739 [Cantharellus anzutake]KAF8343198.1 hypothetical protein EI90DRAFT_3115739 [Cantharellus anzutake]